MTLAKLEIKLTKSTIGILGKHKKTVQALGLKKINQTVVKNDTPQIRGMVNQVEHVVEVKEI